MFAGDKALSRLRFFCLIPYIVTSYPHFSFAGFTTYKLTFRLTEDQVHSYHNVFYPETTYNGYYSMCAPYVQSVNDLLRDRVGHFMPYLSLCILKHR